MARLYVGQCLFGLLGFHYDALRENGWVALFQHVFQLFAGRCSTGNLQLALYSAFATLSVIRLRAIVFCHHFDEFSRQR